MRVRSGSTHAYLIATEAGVVEAGRADGTGTTVAGDEVSTAGRPSGETGAVAIHDGPAPDLLAHEHITAHTLTRSLRPSRQARTALVLMKGASAAPEIPLGPLRGAGAMGTAGTIGGGTGAATTGRGAAIGGGGIGGCCWHWRRGRGGEGASGEAGERDERHDGEAGRGGWGRYGDGSGGRHGVGGGSGEIRRRREAITAADTPMTCAADGCFTGGNRDADSRRKGEGGGTGETGGPAGDGHGSKNRAAGTGWADCTD